MQSYFLHPNQFFHARHLFYLRRSLGSASPPGMIWKGTLRLSHLSNLTLKNSFHREPIAS